ncbi:general substrate transporter [Mollisia scopiformis]|uniref:General substrate transporter n=1 Tax=Mollisia scopiformis TaxID=149040 RepID=A0A132BB97_MOLSC|nr:general substrate transporter [Mollisia scopiformis]KUJ09666.1 general substrate transporter [Mollisia scopiformis]
MRLESQGGGSPEDDEQVRRARAFEAAQHAQSWKEAIRRNPKALLWCAYSLFTCIMWGYDGLASSIVLAIDRFRQDYGDEFEGQYVVPAIWQLALGGASLFGLLFGGIIAGYGAKKWGRQFFMFMSYMLSVAGVFLQWFSSPGNLPLLFGGKVLTGIPLGVFITIAPTYCAEIAPFALRGATTAAVNWSIVFGQCLAYVVMRQTQYFDNANSYRILFAVQWIFAGIALMILPFFPESPYCLVAQGRIDKAMKNTRRLHDANFDTEGFIASIKVDLETQAKTQREASFRECFQGKNTFRTLIAMSTFFIQSVSGMSWIIGYMAYFLELGGLSTGAAFNATVGLSFVMLVGNMVGWVFVERYGRRGTALYGAIILSAALFMIGITASIPSKSAIWAQVFFMAIWSFTYQSTIGSVAWAIVAEVSKSSLRSHTQSLATVTNGLVGAVSGVLLPFAMNPNDADLGGKIAFIYGGILGVSCIGIWMYYPETKGRTFKEIDRLFEMGVPPREFAGMRLEEE